MRWRIDSSVLAGCTTVPGDKSIAHRSLMLASLAPGTSVIRNLPDGADVMSTAACMRSLGVDISIWDGIATVHSSGDLQPAAGVLDAGNSGTTIRLLAGILAGQPFRSVLTGDGSLRRRPMGRVVQPLTAMGAAIDSAGGAPPLEIDGRRLHGIRYRLPIASAQVKSAILLAGMSASGTTVVEEPIRSRDHTERMLRALGIPVSTTGNTIELQGGNRPRAFDLDIPGDISSAGFLLAAAALGNAEVKVEGVGLNPTRSRLLSVLRMMGARVDVQLGLDAMGEPVGSVTVCGRIESPIEIGPEDVPALVDELPLVALLATQANGTSRIQGARELRVKETDRISTVADGLRGMGADIEELPDGWIVRGPIRLKGAEVRSHGDHRLAMMLAIAGTITEGSTLVEGADAAAVSFPSFAASVRALGGTIDGA